LIQKYTSGIINSVAISQPTFLPWIGYFDLIDRSDSFVFLDNAQFSKQSWHQRNRVANNDWITLPIAKGNSLKPLSEVTLGKDRRAYERLFNKIEYVYADYAYFDKYWPQIRQYIEEAITQDWPLSKLNITIITHICSLLKINTKLYLSSEMNVLGNRSQKLVNIIKNLNGSCYISAPGASEYLENDRRFFEKENLPVFLNDIVKYNYTEDVPLSYLSILDTIFKKNLSFFNKFKKTRTELNRFI